MHTQLFKQFCNAWLYYTGIEFKKFPNWVAFTSWKEEEERSTYSCFVKPTGEVVSEETHDGIVDFNAYTRS